MQDLLTPHARTRMQQRGIRADALEALLDYGRVTHVDRGREIVFFDKAARARLMKRNPVAARGGAAAPDLRDTRLGRRRDYRRAPLPADTARLT